MSFPQKDTDFESTALENFKSGDQTSNRSSWVTCHQNFPPSYVLKNYRIENDWIFIEKVNKEQHIFWKFLLLSCQNYILGPDSLKLIILIVVKYYVSVCNRHYRLILWILVWYILTEVAGEGWPDLAPQKFLLSHSLGTSWDAKNM